MAMSNNAAQAMQIRQFRGLPPIMGFDRPDALGSIASSFIAEGAKEAQVDVRGDPVVARSLTVAPDPTHPTQLVSSPGTLGGTAFPTSNIVAVPVVYRWTDAERRVAESVIGEGAARTILGAGQLAAVETHLFAANSGGQGNAAQFFSELDKAGDAGPFVKAIKDQFSEIESISVQLEAGVPLLHSRFADQKQLRPLEFLSGGLTKLSVLLLAISRPSSTLVMVDEIENALHHARWRLLWRQLREFAARANTQVLATTHSLECLDAAADAMAEFPDDFSFLRATRFHGDCVIRLLPATRASELLRSGLEVRG